MEFAEVREYAPGDDVRTIDWNVTARMGVPYVKKFVEERDLTLLLLVDVSGSQDFGSRYLPKRDSRPSSRPCSPSRPSRTTTASGAVLFTDRIERYHAPRKGVDHALAIVRDMLSLDAAGTGTDLALALRSAAGLLKQRSVVFILSDFLAAGYEKAIRALNKRHDVVAIPVSDPREREMPAAGLVRLRDAETGETRVFDASDPAFRQRVGNSPGGASGARRRSFVPPASTRSPCARTPRTRSRSCASSRSARSARRRDDEENFSCSLAHRSDRTRVRAGRRLWRLFFEGEDRPPAGAAGAPAEPPASSPSKNSSSSSPSLSFSAAADRTSVSVGDRVLVTYTAKHARGRDADARRARDARARGGRAAGRRLRSRVRTPPSAHAHEEQDRGFLRVEADRRAVPVRGGDRAGARASLHLRRIFLRSQARRASSRRGTDRGLAPSEGREARQDRPEGRQGDPDPCDPREVLDRARGRGRPRRRPRVAVDLALAPPGRRR